MNLNTPYRHFVSQIVQLHQEAKNFPLGGFPPLPSVEIPSDAPKILIFAPHPDDECIIGGLPLRFLRQSKFQVINVAVTQGSNKDRQSERYRELKAACDYIGFGLVQTGPNGLERINPTNRRKDPAHWAESVSVIAEILRTHSPRAVFFPHELDWNSSHIGSHHLLIDALLQLGPDFACHVFETEFWGQMQSPNLMVESTPSEVADLIAALSFHAGEVRRNPYHLILPGSMQENLRRGTELVGGQGGAAPDFLFATLYRLRKWRQGKLEEVLPRGKILPASESPESLLE